MFRCKTEHNETLLSPLWKPRRGENTETGRKPGKNLSPEGDTPKGEYFRKEKSK